MPLHVANWSQVVLEADLSWADQGKTIRLLANAWSRGDVGDRPSWVTSPAWDAFIRLWPEMMALRHKATGTRDANAARAKAAAEARWAAEAAARGDAPSIPECTHGDAPSIRRASAEHPPSNAQSKDHIAVAVALTESGTEAGTVRTGSAPPSRRCPAGFELSKDRFEYGLSAGLTVEAVGEEFEMFTDHQYRTPRTKWDLAWRAWVRKAVQIRGLGASRAGPQTAAEKTMSNVQKLLRDTGAVL